MLDWRIVAGVREAPLDQLLNPEGQLLVGVHDPFEMLWLSIVLLVDSLVRPQARAPRR